MGFSGFQKIGSLRQRYLTLALIMGLVALGLLSGSQYYISQVGLQSAGDLALRDDVTLQLQRIKSTLYRAESAMEIYMLSPNAASRNAFHTHLLETIRFVRDLEKNIWVKQNKLGAEVATLLPELETLKTHATELTELRLNADAMYPAMQFANGTMLEANKQIKVAIDLAIKESRQAVFVNDGKVLSLLVDMRNAWNRLISAYRLYLINRLGSLFEDALKTQASDVDFRYNHFLKLLGQLEKLVGKNLAALETSLSTETIRENAPVWYNDYQKVVKINLGESWRSDIPLMKNILQPLLLDIGAKLNFLDLI